MKKKIVTNLNHLEVTGVVDHRVGPGHNAPLLHPLILQRCLHVFASCAGGVVAEERHDVFWTDEQITKISN